MADKNLVKQTDLTAVREVDFVARYTRDIATLKNILGNIRTERKAPGTKIVARKAEVTLNTTAVGEGEAIPLNKVDYKDVEVGAINFDKQAVGVSLEAIAEHGYDAAVQKADDDMLYKLESKLTKNFMDFVQTGTLTNTGTITTFQMALATALGLIQNKWESMDRGYRRLVAFVNPMDAAQYLGAANITVQKEFGMNYIESFMNFDRIFMSSRIPQGTVVATPAENVVLYHIDANDSDFSKAGFNFRTDGEKNLIGVNVTGNHGNMSSVLTTITGIALYAEYLDGIAKVTFTATGA